MNAKTTISLILLMISFFSYESKSCSCASDYRENYCENASENRFIALVEITGYVDFETRVISIVENVNNGVTSTEVMLFGLNPEGGNCGEDLGLFSIGDTILMSLYAQDDEEYVLYGGCGLNYLRYSNGQLQGQLFPNITNVDYEEFKTNLNECLGYELVSVEKIGNEKEIIVHPNPTKDYITLTFDNEEKINKIEIYSIVGNQLMEYNGQDLSYDNTILDLSMFDKGLYILKVTIGDKEYIKKIIKE